MDMITEHNYGVPIPLSHDDHSSHMDDIHTEMEKRLIVFLALPGKPFFNHSIARVQTIKKNKLIFDKSLKAIKLVEKVLQVRFQPHSLSQYIFEKITS